MNAYEYNKNDEMRKMLRTTATLEPMVLQMSGLCFITQEGITMSNCKTCSQAISWDQKKREALHIRGPLNADGTVHFCYKEQEAKKIGIVIDGCSNQMVAGEKKPFIDERPLAKPTTQDTPKTTEDLLTRIAIALEDVAVSLKLQGGYTGVKQ